MEHGPPGPGTAADAPQSPTHRKPHATMEPAEILERESRYGRTAGVLGILGVLCVLAPSFIGLGSEFNTAAQDAYAERFELFDANKGEILAAQALQAIGLILFAPPLFFLFQAAADRSSAVRRSLIGLTVVGPLFFGFALVLFFVAYNSATPTFIDGAPAGGDLNQFAEDTLTEESTWGAYLGLQLAAALSLVFAVVYTSLQAMRVGLLTRFLGTLGMALGVGFLLFGPLGPLALGLFIVTISLLIADLWRGERPPAWETGEAIPWLKAGDTPPPTEEELADAAEFEGEGREVADDEIPELAGDDPDDAADTEAPDEGPTGRPGRRDNKRKRKRKQRR